MLGGASSVNDVRVGAGGTPAALSTKVRRLLDRLEHCVAGESRHLGAAPATLTANLH